jgi:hypothetical protein
MYSDLKTGGFFEYASTSLNHLNMNIFMNTPTLQYGGVTKFLGASNANNKFLDGCWYYSEGIGIAFDKVLTGWLNNANFAYDSNSRVFLVAGWVFRSDWLYPGWGAVGTGKGLTPGAQPPIYMNAASFSAGDTSLMFFNSNATFGGDNQWYVSPGGYNLPLAFLFVDALSTAQSLNTTLFMVYPISSTYPNQAVIFNAINGTGTLVSRGIGSYKIQNGVYGAYGNSNSLNKLQVNGPDSSSWLFSIDGGTTWI